MWKEKRQRQSEERRYDGRGGEERSEEESCPQKYEKKILTKEKMRQREESDTQEVRDKIFNILHT